MKVKRLKRAKRIITFYKNKYGFMSPYRILVDGTFAKAALQFKLNILEQLPRYLESEIRPATTNCIVQECEALGSLLYGPLKVLQQYNIFKCGHTGRGLPAAECIRSVIGSNNSRKFFLATQDFELMRNLQQVPGLPHLFISYNVIVLERPTDASVSKPETDEQSTHHDAVLNKLKVATFGEEEPIIEKKKRKFKGQNPLSCKKKKFKGEYSASVEGKEGKKARKRKKLKQKLEGTVSVNGNKDEGLMKRKRREEKTDHSGSVEGKEYKLEHSASMDVKEDKETKKRKRLKQKLEHSFSVERKEGKKDRKRKRLKEKTDV